MSDLSVETTQLRTMLDRRMRLVWAALFVGVAAGFCLSLFVSQPPVWIDDLPQTVVMPCVCESL